MNKKNRNRGFTLRELIIVVAIVAILSALISVNLLRYLTKAKKAMDKVTAEEIANAYELAALTDPNIYRLYKMWESQSDPSIKNLVTTVSATVNGVTERYKVILVVASELTYFTGGQTQYLTTDFYKALNDAIGLEMTKDANVAMMPRYKIKLEGPHTAPDKARAGVEFGYVDRWRIVLRCDTGEVEVWSADGSKFGGWPQFRVYPNPDDAYN